MAVAMSQQIRQPFSAVNRLSTKSTTRTCRLVVRSQQKQEAVPVAVAKPALIALAANAMLAAPALASETPGVLFDFGLTLPFMAGQFLLLMVFLDKTWFGPVGKHLDARDKMIRDKLAAFREGTTEVADLQAQAEAIIKEARAEAQKTILAAKAEAQAESTKKLEAVKAKIDKELADAMAALDKEKATALASLDSQVDKLAADILTRILPEGVKI